jgi:hypothetical protein
VRALGAFQHRLVAEACKHEVGDAPNVDFRDNDGVPIRPPYTRLTCRFLASSGPYRLIPKRPSHLALISSV